MSVKEIHDGIEKGLVLFGIREALKRGKDATVFISKDTRDETVERLEQAGLEFTVLKTKEDMARELNLSFACEVFSVVRDVAIKAGRKNKREQST